MFGYQRIGDLVWAASDARAKGFLLGATAGRTTLNGEGLQHQDGHSHLLYSVVPTVRAYDPAFAFELAVIVHDGLKRMYQDQENCFYYITIYNENYPMPKMPDGCADGVVRGLYLFQKSPNGAKRRVQLLGSGTILREALRAQTILAEKFDIAADVWSATSYLALRRDAMEADRWNLFHPEEEPRVPYVVQQLADTAGPIVAASDYMRAVPEQIAKWLPGRFTVLGTDGFGRSDTRGALRRHFEVDAESIAYAALYELAKRNEYPVKQLAKAMKDLGIDPTRRDPWTV
jgi:pyruvate dehydrogenase E1 component